MSESTGQMQHGRVCVRSRIKAFPSMQGDEDSIGDASRGPYISQSTARKIMFYRIKAHICRLQCIDGL